MLESRIESRRRTYMLVDKGMKIAMASALLIIGFAALVYLLTIGSELISSNINSIDGRAASAGPILQGFYGFLNTTLWIFAIFSGAIFSLAYAVYVIDVIRDRREEGRAEGI